MGNLYLLLIFFLLFASTWLLRSSKNAEDKTPRLYYLVCNLVIIIGLVLLYWFPLKGVYSSVLYDWLPFLLLPFFHRETALLTTAISPKTHDEAFIQYEQDLFPGVIHFHQQNRMNSVIVSELLHLCYLSFFLLIYGVPFYFYACGDLVAFYATSFGVFFTLLSCFMTHTYLPVLGPRTLFKKIDDARSDGIVFRLTHRVLESGSTPGTAFPSGHTSLACVLILLTPLFQTQLFYFVLPIGIGLMISTIYGRFHYVLDLLAGIVYAIISFIVTYCLYVLRV